MPPSLKAADPFSGNDLVVAVDFGTTRTAYAITQQGGAGDSIEVAVPSKSGALSTVYDAKTPSSVLLNEDGSRAIAYGYAAEEKYARKEKTGCMLFRWFKMELHNSHDQDPTVQSLSGKSLKLSVVITKALEYIREDVLKKLNKKGHSVQATNVIWVLTVPAIWNDWAKNLMRTAAHRAGLIQHHQSRRLKIALEPECACISLQMEKTHGSLTEIGQKLMIVDCGGGTVDVTAHQVESMEPLRLKELMAPDGGAFGATEIDKRFFQFFESFVGSDNYKRLKQTSAFLSLARNWEDRKMAFTGTDGDDDDDGDDNDEDCVTPLNVGDVLAHLDMVGNLDDLVTLWNRKHPRRKAEAISGWTLGLSFNLVMSFFNYPIGRIKEKLGSILSSPMNSQSLHHLDIVIIAGGFGSSLVLQRELQQFFHSRELRVIVCQHPDLAIVKGAAAFGARPSVIESRKSKYTYGVGADNLFASSNPVHKVYEGQAYLARDGKIRIPAFCIARHVGDDISTGTLCTVGTFTPMVDDDSRVTIPVLAATNYYVQLQCEPGVRELAAYTMDWDRSVPFADRHVKVDFSFGESEILCMIYMWTLQGYVQVHEAGVKFPSDVHWAHPTAV